MMKLPREDLDLLKSLLEPVALTITSGESVKGVGYQPTLSIGDSAWGIVGGTFNCRCTLPEEGCDDEGN